MTLKSVPLALLLVLPLQAFAFGEPYRQARFDALMQEGKPILVHVHAHWCSTCRAQDMRLESLLPSPGNAAIQALEVNFDEQKEALRALGARSTSVLIAFREGREVGRLVGQTGERPIAELLASLR
jgi:thioredoxin 1